MTTPAPNRPRCAVCATTDHTRLMLTNADPPNAVVCHTDFLAAMATLGPPDTTAFCTRCASRAVVAIGTLASAHGEHQPLTRACRPCLTSAITDLATHPTEGTP